MWTQTGPGLKCINIKLFPWSGPNEVNYRYERASSRALSVKVQEGVDLKVESGKAGGKSETTVSAELHIHCSLLNHKCISIYTALFLSLSLQRWSSCGEMERCRYCGFSLECHLLPTALSHMLLLLCPCKILFVSAHKLQKVWQIWANVVIFHRKFPTDSMRI